MATKKQPKRPKGKPVGTVPASNAVPPEIAEATQPVPAKQPSKVVPMPEPAQPEEPTYRLILNEQQLALLFNMNRAYREMVQNSQKLFFPGIDDTPMLETYMRVNKVLASAQQVANVPPGKSTGKK